MPDPSPTPVNTPAGDRPALRRPLRVALAHDWLVGYRGGEAVLAAIARLLRAQPDRFRIAGLYTMFDDGRPLDPSIDDLPKRVSPLGRLPGATGRLRRWLLPVYPAAVGRLSAVLASDHARAPIDLLISTSSAAIKGLRPPPGVPHLCYCHAPARYIWSQSDDYARGSAGRLRAAGLRAFSPALRRWDRATAANVTRFLANSTHTARQIRECYARDSRVVFPPVRTEFFTPDPAAPRADHWLYVGALEPYKRVDLAVRAAALAGRSLVVVGSGSQERHLRQIAGSNVEFAGRVDDAALLARYRAAQALLFPQVEDFGIVAAEAQACGLPVVAFALGGALDTVIDGQTGVLFREPTPESLADAASRLPLGPGVAQACRRSASRFSEGAFAARFQQELDALTPRP